MGDDIKEAAVKYGLEHGWTAAAAKYGTSSTSVSRWATYDDPKSPWKFKVIVIARRIGVKEAAKRFKVALSTLEEWIKKSSKYCEHMNEEDFDMEDDEDGQSIEDVESKLVKSKITKENLVKRRNGKVVGRKLHEVETEGAKIETNDYGKRNDVEKCKTCNKQLSRDESMLEHIMANHLDNVGACEVCGEDTEDVVEHSAAHLEKNDEEDEGGTENDQKTVIKEDISEVYVKDLLQDLLVDV